MTLVLAQIKDLAGNIYAGALVEASYLSNIPVGTGTGPPLASGSVFQTFAVSETDSFGNLSMSLTDLAAITPTGGSWNFNVLNNARTIGFNLNSFAITGPTVDISAALQAVAAPLNPTVAFGNITVTGLVDSGNATVGGTLGVTGATTLANVNMGTANTLSVNNIKQQAGAALLVQDPNGQAHFFISNSAPYTNTFVQGNGSGGILLGSAAKTSVADTTGNIVTAGNIAFQTTSQTLPATIVNDTLGGLLFTTNAGKGWQIANATGQLQGFAGVNILLQGSSSGSITLAVPAAAGSNTLTLPAATDTLVAKSTTDTFTNKTLDTAGAGNVLKINGSQVTAVTGSTQTVVLSTGPTIFGGILYAGATSGTTTLVATATASGTLTLPAATDTLVGKATTDTLTNKTLSSPTITSPTTTGTDSGTETLQNKTFTGATTGNNLFVLNAQGATGALTGNSADQVVYTYTLPLNTIDTNSKGIRITCAGTHSSGTANPTVKINLNGQNIVTGSIGTTASQSVTFGATILRTGTTTGESAGIATVTGALNPFSVTIGALSWASNQTVTMTFNVANTDQFTGRMFLVEQIQ